MPDSPVRPRSPTRDDGFGGFDSGLVTINVTNSAPVADDETYTTRAGQALTVTAPGILDGDTDADGDTLTVASVNITGLQGTLNPQANGSFIFTPTAGFTGTTSFTYSVSDGFGGFDTGLVTINVEPDNRAPVIVAVADQTVSELGVLTIDVDATDPDGDTVTFELVSGPEGAFIDVATGQIVWSAPVLTPGVPLDFLVRASDGTTFTDEAFTVTVLPDYLRVTSFASSANGFHVGFNRVFDVTTLNLYEGASAPRPLPPADVLLTTLGGTNQAGSIVLDEDQKGFTFIRTGEALAAGSYRATLTSSALGIHDLYGRALDGDADGNAGGNAVEPSRWPRRRRCCRSAMSHAVRARPSACPPTGPACPFA